MPKVIIDTLEYDFVMRRLNGRGYTKYFKALNSTDFNVMQIIPNFSKLGDENDYVKTLLTIMIKEEIKHRQDIEYLHNGTTPNTFYASISKIKLNNYITDNVANTISAQKVHNVLVTKQWKLHNLYLSNLNDIRTSIRLQKKKELRQEKKLEQLRGEQLLLSRRRSHSRTKLIIRKLEENLFLMVPELSLSPPSTPQMYLSPQVFPTGRRRKRPKMIIVDKPQRRPPS
jgi:hypothetical protein